MEPGRPGGLNPCLPRGHPSPAPAPSDSCTRRGPGPTPWVYPPSQPRINPSGFSLLTSQFLSRNHWGGLLTRCPEVELQECLCRLSASPGATVNYDF